MKKSYKNFLLWKKFQYLRFVLNKGDRDSDGLYLVKMNIFKLTMMGLQYAKFNKPRSEDVRVMWKARKLLKNYLNAEDILIESAQRTFRKKFGFSYVPKFSWVKTDGGEVLESRQSEMDDFWDSLDPMATYEAFTKGCLRSAFFIMSENIPKWSLDF